MDYMASCFNLALMYDGNGLIKDEAKAKNLYKKVCKGVNKYACKRYEKFKNK